MSTKIKIVPDHLQGAEKIVKQARKDNPCNLDRNSWWYLHGQLASKFDYDKGVMLNLSEFPQYVKKSVEFSILKGGTTDVDEFKDRYMAHINAVVPVEVIGESEECVGYFWTVREYIAHAYDKNGNVKSFPIWEQRGLVCLKSDKWSCDDAYEKYIQRAEML